MLNLKRSLLTIVLLLPLQTLAIDLCGKPGGLGGGKDPLSLSIDQAHQVMMSPQAEYLPSLAQAYRQLFTHYSALMSKSIPIIPGGKTQARWRQDIELLLYRLSTQISNVQGLEVTSPRSTEPYWASMALIFQPDVGTPARTILERNGLTVMYSPRIEMEIALGFRGPHARQDLLELQNTVYVPLEVFLDTKSPEAKEFFKGFEGEKKPQLLVAAPKPESAFQPKTYAIKTDLEFKTPARDPSKVEGHLKDSYGYFGLLATATYNEMVDAYWRTSEQLEARIARMPRAMQEREAIGLRQILSLHWQTLLMTN